MTAGLAELAKEIARLTAKLAGEGWDRLRAVRLADVSQKAAAEAARAEWHEAAGRAGILAESLAALVAGNADDDRLARALHSAINLAALLERGAAPAAVPPALLPRRPGDWTFVWHGSGYAADDACNRALRTLGFRVHAADEVEAGAAADGRRIELALVSWLAEGGDLAQWTPAPGLRVAIADRNDFRSQLAARRAGARVLVAAPPDLRHLIGELAGLAWTPRIPYRVMLVDDDRAMVELHAMMLRENGIEVAAFEDPVAALEVLADFSPEALVVDVEMPACRGPELAALVRRLADFAQLPVIFLSAFADAGRQQEARDIGSQDYLVKPVDRDAFVAAVRSRARHFRAYAAAVAENLKTTQNLENLRQALDLHAAVTVATLDGTIVEVNDKFCQDTGYGRSDWLGRDHRMMRSGRHDAEFYRHLRDTLRRGDIWQGEIHNRRRDGGDYWAQTTIVPILGDNGRPEHYVSLRTDITEQKRLQAERERHIHLLELLRDTMQAFIAHQDIGQSASRLLEGTMALTGSTAGAIAEIVDDAEPGRRLCLLALPGRDDAGAHVIAADAHGDKAEIPATGSFLAELIEDGATVLANNPGRDRRTGIARWDMAIENLLAIPIRYGNTLVGLIALANRPGGFDPTIEAELAPLITAFAHMIEAVRLRRFQQLAIEELSAARTAAEKAARAKAEFLAGMGHRLRTPLNAILVHSQLLQGHPDLGAEIAEQVAEIARAGDHFATLIGDLIDQIDRNDGGNAIDTLPRNAAPSGDARRILVAEDDMASRTVLRMQLEVLGYAVDASADGNDALARWQAGSHDLILVDRYMPGLDGLSLCRAIRAAQGSDGRVPIIGISALPYGESLAPCRAAGMDDVLSKPIELDALRQTLDRWLAPKADAVHGEAADDAIVDWPFLLAQVGGSADTGAAHALLQVFLESAGNELSECRHCLRRGQLGAIAERMHKLKASAASTGARRAAAIARAIEDGARQGDADRLAGLLDALDRALAAVADFAARGNPPAATPARPPDCATITAEALQAGIRLDQFDVVFQPIVEGGSGRPVAVEALARWRHASGDFPPEQFIDAARRFGALGPLSELLLTKALLGGARLAEAGHPLEIAVNLPVAWLADGSLPAFLQATLTVAGLPADRLVIEIAETELATAGNIGALLRPWQRQAIRLSIGHDPGSPTARMLAGVPGCGEIKFDRRWLQAAFAGDAGRSALAGAAGTARAAGIRTVAVGVESAAERETVVALGMDRLQGWHIARPMDTDAVSAWLRGRQAKA